MRYRIELDDKSFIAVYDEYKLKLYKNSFFYKRLTIKDYLTNYEKYKNCFLYDNIKGKKVKRKFKIVEDESITDKMLEHRFKLVKDITLNDSMIGPDFERLEIEELHSEEDDMYEILDEEGNSYIVNSTHVLQLKNCCTLEDIQITVKDFLIMEDKFKSECRIVRV